MPIILILALWTMGLTQVSHAADMHKLTIKTTPSDANIYLMNVQTKFKQGMSLKAGKYDVIVSKAGYQKQRRWVDLRRKDVKLTIALKPIQKTTAEYTLTVTTVPEDATVRLMNVKTDFEQGMSLKPGKYDLLVSKKGYPSRQQWITITDQDVNMDVILTPATKTKQTLSIQSAHTERQYALRVKTTPTNATIQIMNVTPKFEQGMLLSPGKYYLRISKAGYPIRREWVEIVNKNLTIAVVLSPPARCFFGEEINEDDGQRSSILRNVKLNFHEHFVDASYNAHSMPSGKINAIEFRGVRRNDNLELIGIVDYEGIREELKATMLFQGDQLLIDVNGSKSLLNQINCQ